MAGGVHGGAPPISAAVFDARPGKVCTGRVGWGEGEARWGGRGSTAAGDVRQGARQDAERGVGDAGGAGRGEWRYGDIARVKCEGYGRSHGKGEWAGMGLGDGVGPVGHVRVRVRVVV